MINQFQLSPQVINHILINVWSVAHSCTGPITAPASSLNSFIAPVLVKYLLQSCRKLKWLFEGDAAWCLHVSGQSVVSCAVTQEITGKNSLLLIIRIPCLRSALLKDRKTPLSGSEVEQSIGPFMNSLQMTESINWNTDIIISCRKKNPNKTQQHVALRTRVITVSNTARFPGHSLLSVIGLTTSCDEEQRGRNTVKWAHLSCNWSPTYRWAEPPRALSLWVWLCCPKGSWPQIIQGWAGLRAFSALQGQVRPSQHFSKYYLDLTFRAV